MLFFFFFFFKWLEEKGRDGKGGGGEWVKVEQASHSCEENFRTHAPGVNPGAQEWEDLLRQPQVHGANLAC